MLMLAFSLLTNFSSFPTPPHPIKEFLVVLIQEEEAIESHQPDYRYIVILRDNLEMVIIFNREEIDGMDY